MANILQTRKRFEIVMAGWLSGIESVSGKLLELANATALPLLLRFLHHLLFVSAGYWTADNRHSVEKLLGASGDIICKNSVFEQGKFYL